ncbi:hypothetical protein [Cellulomonas sp. URHD0024]|uniref:hypothetical protein n=1 Tax=Cellulomonas sp. URHD0024 TaxID=1302620 RepID=UPI000427221E|nr:hypothetical protein [Cellulomonas sp. URHD0024]
MAGFRVGVLLLEAVVIAFSLLCYVVLARKAGYSGWYAALCVVPLLGFVVMLIFVFKEWPIQAEVRRLQAAGGGGYINGYPSFDGYGSPPPSGRAPYAQPAPWDQPPQQQHPGYPPAGGYPEAPDGTPPSWYGPQG